jgi:hypothetical protein
MSQTKQFTILFVSHYLIKINRKPSKTDSQQEWHNYFRAVVIQEILATNIIIKRSKNNLNIFSQRFLLPKVSFWCKVYFVFSIAYLDWQICISSWLKIFKLWSSLVWREPKIKKNSKGTRWPKSKLICVCNFSRKTIWSSKSTYLCFCYSFQKNARSWVRIPLKCLFAGKKYKTIFLAITLKTQNWPLWTPRTLIKSN